MIRTDPIALLEVILASHIVLLLPPFLHYIFPLLPALKIYIFIYYINCVPHKNLIKKKKKKSITKVN